MVDLKKTKMTCTIGPATWDTENLEKLIKAGMNVARLNFSHGDYNTFKDIIKTIRSLSADLNIPVAILQDLQGPKIRVGVLPDEPRKITTGEELILTLDDKNLEPNDIPVQYDFIQYMKPDDTIYLDDGYMELKTIKKLGNGKLLTKVVHGGNLKSKKGINLPDTFLPDASMTKKDREDLDFGISQDVDYIGLSFVQTVDDIEACRNILKKAGSRAKVVSKIERKAAVANLEDMVRASDAIMLARGDLAVEAGMTEVPIAQREAVKLTRQMKKPIIIATQVLESMITNPRPTRAEANDAAVAAYDQVDSLMLSGESAAGQFPILAAQTMTDISERISHEALKDRHFNAENVFKTTEQTDAVAMAAFILAERIGAKAIVIGTATGGSAAALSNYRPSQTIFAVTDDQKVYNQLALYWGVRSLKMKKVKDASEFVENAVKDITRMGWLKKGDLVVVANGSQTGIPGGTNMIKVETI
jgi:pyruvate kinase